MRLGMGADATVLKRLVETVRLLPAGIRINPIPWAELLQLVADGRPASLGQLGRSPLGLKHYKDTLDRVILSRFASVSDFPDSSFSSLGLAGGGVHDSCAARISAASML